MRPIQEEEEAPEEHTEERPREDRARAQPELSHSQGDWPQSKPDLQHLALGLLVSRTEEK